LEFIWNTAFLHFSVLVYCTVMNREFRTRKGWSTYCGSVCEPRGPRFPVGEGRNGITKV